jgi:hypothetical protein
MQNTKALANTSNENPWMELTEENFRAGYTYVVDEIKTKGAEMLTTKYNQTEMAFAVTGLDIKCAGRRFAMIGPPHHHEQYMSSIPNGLFRLEIQKAGSRSLCSKWVRRKVPQQGPRNVEEPLKNKNMSASSWMVYIRELGKYELRTVFVCSYLLQLHQNLAHDGALCLLIARPTPALYAPPPPPPPLPPPSSRPPTLPAPFPHIPLELRSGLTPAIYVVQLFFPSWLWLWPLSAYPLWLQPLAQAPPTHSLTHPCLEPLSAMTRTNTYT